jgi:hypothetical protein
MLWKKAVEQLVTKENLSCDLPIITSFFIYPKVSFLGLNLTLPVWIEKETPCLPIFVARLPTIYQLDYWTWDGAVAMHKCSWPSYNANNKMATLSFNK